MKHVFDNRILHAAVVLLFMLPAMPAQAKWLRILLSAKGESVDLPTPHPLDYFTANPFLRDDGSDFCVDCDTPQGRAESAHHFHAASGVRPVGTLEGFKIVDVFYRVSRPGAALPIHPCWKSILVETAPGQYVEIYHLQQYYIAAPVTPSKIIKVSGESILQTFMRDGGKVGGVFQDYWWFDASGAHTLNLSPVTAAVVKLLPPGSLLASPCPFDVPKLEFKSRVVRNGGECLTCGGGGIATAHFRLAGARAEPIDAKFVPEADGR